MMNKITGQTLFRKNVHWLISFFLAITVVQLSACGGGGGSPEGDGVAPTAVLDVVDGAGRPLTNGSIDYGEDFILYGKRSTDAGGGRVVGYRWKAVTSSGGGMSLGKPVDTDSATLRITASAEVVPLGVQEYELIVVDDSENVSKPVRVQVVVRDNVAPTAVLEVADDAGRPLVNGSIEQGRDFLLSAKRSSDAGGGSIVKYLWTAVTAPIGPFAGTGTVVTDTYQLTINASSTPVPAGTQTYRLVTEDDSGNRSAPVEVQVVVFVPNVAPTAVMSLSRASGFAPLTIDFDAGGSSDPDGTIVSYAWSFGDGSGGSGVSVSHTYQTPGSYGIALTVTDDAGATGIVDPKPQVQVLPPPVVSITPDNAALEPNTTQQFTAKVTGADDTGVVWSLADSGCGSLDASGLFVAGDPARSCTNTVRAVSRADDRVSATASVRIATCSNAVYDVNATADAGDANPGDKICDDGSGNCTLRAAIEEANACLGPNTVNVPAGTYVLSLGQLGITDELIVSGAGATATIIDGNDASRIFSVAGGLAAVSLSDLTLANGRVNSSGPAIQLGGNTPMQIRRAILRDNAAQSNGCTIKMHKDASLELVETSLVHNRCEGTGPGGSAIMMDAGDNLVIRSSTIAYNGPSSSGSGAGVIMEWSHGENPISVSIENSTIAGNQGPAIKATSWVTVDIKNSTITNNDEGIRVGSGNGGASTVNIGNAILYANGSNCAINGGSIVSAGHNIDSRNTCGFTGTGDMVNTNPQLGPLVDNGGPTQTRGLLAGSPALNAGDNVTCLASDQRGGLRDDGSCDIGAYEGEVTLASCLGGNLLVTSTLDAVDAAVGDGICDDGNGNCTLRAAVQEANACVGYDVIALPAGTYPLSIARNPSGDTVDAVNGDLDVTDDLRIQGTGAATTLIDGSDVALDDRLFQVVRNVPVAFDGLTLQGVATAWYANGAGIASNGDLQLSNTVISNNTGGHGAAIYAGDPLTTTTITNSTLSGNNGKRGGAVYVAGTLTVTHSTLSGNTAEDYGGAIYGHNGSVININKNSLIDDNDGWWASVVGMDNATITLAESIVSNARLHSGPSNAGNGGVWGWTNSTINIINSTISGSVSGRGVTSTGAYGYGGGSVLVVRGSTISGNSIANHGAGVFADGSFTISDSTISNNSIPYTYGISYVGQNGAGLSLSGTGTISNCSITGNVTNSTNGLGGGISLDNATLTISGTSVTANAPDDCRVPQGSVIISDGTNSDSDGSCGF